jgi:geranylgeranyl reductase family protein
MKTVAVLGGGPAGSFAAQRLASAGLKTMLFDEKLAWEKPCGGGLTYKAYKEYPFLIDNDTPKKLITESTITAPRAGEVKMPLGNPLVIYSRFDLNKMLLDRAEKAGAQMEQTRVQGLEKTRNGWKIQTKNGVAEADYCIVAMGARNPVKHVGTEWKAADTATALGYFVPAKQDHIDIQFLPEFEGYIWVFPRAEHLSVGICGKGEPAQKLRERLHLYMDEHCISRQGATYYGHVLPSLETPQWRSNRVSGDGWLAVGDSAGLVDPITGEGLYYAMRSGDLASQIVLDDSHSLDQKAAAYRSVIGREFLLDLEFAAMLAKRVFLGKFMFRSVPQRMVEFIRRSPRFLELMQDLFAGTQSYMELRGRLLKNINGTLQEILMNFFLERVIPERSQV